MVIHWQPNPTTTTTNISRNVCHSHKWNLLDEHLLQAVHDDNTQLRAQHGPEHALLLVLVGQPVPPQYCRVVIGLVRVLVPLLSHAALQKPQEPQPPTTQLTGQHLHEDKYKRSDIYIASASYSIIAKLIFLSFKKNRKTYFYASQNVLVT
jgi:hypothetical protein